MFKHYAKRTVKKLIALPLWLVFIVINLLAKPVAFILRIFSVPYAILSVVYAVMEYMENGVNVTLTQPLMLALAMTVIFFIAPHIESWTYNIKCKLKTAALNPIVVKPPVRYKADFLYY